MHFKANTNSDSEQKKLGQYIFFQKIGGHLNFGIFTYFSQ